MNNLKGFSQFLFLTAIFFIGSCAQIQQNRNEVTIIKQWHFAPGVNTTEVERFTSDPRYTNQLDIYKLVSKKIEENKTKLIIAEGCEGEINNDFKAEYNGWSMAKLNSNLTKEAFEKIMAPVPMKIKSKYSQVKVICGDNEELIQKHLLAFSDLKGYLGIFSRLSSVGSKQFEKYHQLLENIAKKKLNHPIKYSIEKARESWGKVLQYTHERNDQFIKTILNNLNSNPTVVIGGVHVDDIVKKLEAKAIKVNVITPQGYKNESLHLIQAVEKVLNYNPNMVTLYQVPEGLNLQNFPYQNQIEYQQMTTTLEWKDLTALAKSSQIPIAILTSDFDRDQIRDFTLSRSSGKVFLTAEDPDWDNDGIPNLQDPSLGAITFNIATDIDVTNVFNILPFQPSNELQSLKENGVFLLNQGRGKHDFLVIKMLTQIFGVIQTSKERIQHFIATEPKIKYGENVFFSFIKHTRTLEFYPESFYQHIQKKRNEFKGVSDEDFVMKVVMPIIIHSLGHEVAHSLEIPSDSYLKEQQWQWKSIRVKGKYLKKFRHPKKVLSTFKNNYSYRGLSSKEWNERYESYLKIRNKQRLSTTTIDSPWKTGLAQLDLKHSFLAMENLPSIYALSQPEEWYAEMVAGCIWQKLLSKKITKGGKDKAQLEAAARYELIIGFNPFAPEINFCNNNL